MEKLNFYNFNIYRFVFEYINSNMYILIKNKEALVIDPHYNSEVDFLFQQNNIENVTILLTHEHPDHISGIKKFTEKYVTKVICHKKTAEIIKDRKNTRPILISFILEEKDTKEGTDLLSKFNDYYETFSYVADVTFEDNFECFWENYKLNFIYTPGHSQGSCCIMMENKFLFTGDTLMKDIPIITRFPGGNIKDYLNITFPILKNFDKNLIVLPGHGKIFRFKELYKEGHLNVEFK